MGPFKAIFLLLALSLCGTLAKEFSHLNELTASASSETQAQAARNLLTRTVGSRASEFIVVINSSLSSDAKDAFQLMSMGDQIEISGTTGVAVSMGFYYYLKYYCKAQKTWAGQQLHLPSTLPAINSPLKVTANDRYRYYQNVCTLSYTMAFWNWIRWEQEIDWMALRGINLPLAFVGQEAIFQRVYLSLGFKETELNAHFGGPAFLAWSRMGNIRGWGGPLPQMWITQKLLLQHQILTRMRSLGMTPVLPGFAGHVPAAITRVFPNANFTRLGEWGHFNATYSATYLLDFHDPLFKRIGNMFIQALTNEFGTDHVYNADTFNEMDPQSSNPSYLQAAGKAVFEGMVGADPKAVWLMQGWMFGHSHYWGPPQVKALVTSVPQGRMIILDLYAEEDPIYKKYESFYGQPFIWCMLHNFGGTMELYGDLDSVSKGPFAGRAFPNSTMIGTGMAPEGIHQNEIMYEIMSEHAWRPKLWDVNEWVQDFAGQRYGIPDPLIFDAWYNLQTTVYNCTDGHSDNDYVLITRRPTIKYNVSSDVWYKTSDFFKAWDHFVAASHNHEGSELFYYDLVDVTRNSLQLVAQQYYSQMMDAYHTKDQNTIEIAGNKLSDLFTDMDKLLASNDRFLLGRWIADAIFWATDAKEKALYEYNARNQITLWGPDGEIHDYASKQWSGVMKDFYKPRFEFFTKWIQQLIINGTEWDAYVFTEHILSAVETPWTISRYAYPINPSGNPISIVKALHTKYRPETYTAFIAGEDKETQKNFPKEQRHRVFQDRIKHRWAARRI